MSLKPAERVYLLAVVLLAALFVANVASRAFEAAPSSALRAGATAGRPRDVDVERLLERIRRGEATDREALFWRPVEPP